MEARITPEMIIQTLLDHEGIQLADLDIAPVLVLSWGRFVIESLAEETGAKRPAHCLFNEPELFFTGKVGTQRVSFVHSPIGAPGTIARMEQLIACGVNTIIGLGWAGTLQPEIPIGSFIIPTACVREEGTSPHYIDDPSLCVPSNTLVKHLKHSTELAGFTPHLGLQWTTDAPYRELVGKIDAYRRRGVLGVDMETSAMYALGQFRNVQVANILVVSDEVWKAWNPAFGTELLKEATIRAQNVVLHCLSELPSANPPFSGTHEH